MVVSTAFGAQQSVLPYVDGTPIQPSVIVSQLGAMYNGTTPNLLVGIAFRESSCSQFLFTTNPYINQTYGIAGYWPNENANGTYIGLMMVPPTLSTLFDWTSNAAQGLSVLQYFLAAAARHYSQEIASYPSLPSSLLCSRSRTRCGCTAGGVATAITMYQTPVTTGGW